MSEIITHSACAEEDILLMRAHLTQLAKTSAPQDFGLLSYNYNNGQTAPDYYSPHEVNIGDYIQSLAARQFLPRVNEYIDRDNLKFYDSSPVRMIMNAWYSIWKNNSTFAPQITPLLVSIHLNNTSDIPASTLDYLKQHEPVGCRDLATRDFLRGHQIKAYFSGCMTLTLGRGYGISERQRTNDVCFVDYELNKRDPFKDEVKKILKPYRNSSFKYFTHDYPFGRSPEAYLSEAERLINIYARAKLVITSRIHCALPCLALGTPVILICRRYDSKRFNGLFRLFNFIGLDKNNLRTADIRFDKNNMVVNKDFHHPLAENLTTLCTAFTAQNPKAANLNPTAGFDNGWPYHPFFRLVKRTETPTKVIWNILGLKFSQKK